MVATINNILLLLSYVILYQETLDPKGVQRTVSQGVCVMILIKKSLQYLENCDANVSHLVLTGDDANIFTHRLPFL